jgi:hypothetical protein
MNKKENVSSWQLVGFVKQSVYIPLRLDDSINAVIQSVISEFTFSVSMAAEDQFPQNAAQLPNALTRTVDHPLGSPSLGNIQSTSRNI